MLLTVVLLLLGGPLFSQNIYEARYVSIKYTEYASLSNIERYGLDYEVLNYDFQGDSTILNQINLADLDQYRREDGKNKAFDENTGLTVVLYPWSSLPGKKESEKLSTKSEEQ